MSKKENKGCDSFPLKMKALKVRKGANSAPKKSIHIPKDVVWDCE